MTAINPSKLPPDLSVVSAVLFKAFLCVKGWNSQTSIVPQEMSIDVTLGFGRQGVFRQEKVRGTYGCAKAGLGSKVDSIVHRTISNSCRR